MRRTWLFPLLLATTVVLAADAPPEAKHDSGAAKEKTHQEEKKEAKKEDPKKQEGPKTLDGMSILGNQEAPKSLVIVPWKSSELGDSLGFSTMFDDSRQPIDKEVFMRALSYYQIRSETPRPAEPAAEAHRSKP